ncbi:MAG: hypothetical protein A2817_00960 [Candidatus Yanofskybacteria bacterium RIFCSPHIGHO2_01_FULL_39_8b]|uniref:Uncharacterized protein n=1 Tax=Candidatus Yanofskybacteria bacterium RIFCSPHIGHO2_01_FULL_39_8b TaxID=1802659 RepID=A0A1F8EH12_9BACT|nr:MAG: hypothetical protein A2817_00960 [Candidatus Yanofskybacteria bacterium RIFCSPHIGHO2_01_FULL_39_8b]
MLDSVLDPANWELSCPQFLTGGSLMLSSHSQGQIKNKERARREEDNRQQQKERPLVKREGVMGL